MITGLIFDFDGLILDTESADYLSWKETYEAFGVDLPLPLWQQYIGTTTFDPYAYLESCLGGPVDRTAVHARRKQRDNELIAAAAVLPGVEAYLTQAQALGLRIGLASSSRHDWVEPHLERLGLTAYFEVIACRDDVADRPKPDPAVYRYALARLGAPPQQVLALEDSPHGVAAAKGAGVWVTAVPNQMTRTLSFAQADYQLTALTEMPLAQLIQEVWRA